MACAVVTSAAMHPFEHRVFVCPTSFNPTKPANEEIVQDEVRNPLICTDVITAVHRGRSPIILIDEVLDAILRFLNLIG